MTNLDQNYQVATVLGHAVTKNELTAFFNQVADKTNWKNRIDATIYIAGDREMAMYREAVIFFTGSVPTFEPRAGGQLPGCRYRVRAAGYYATIGA